VQENFCEIHIVDLKGDARSSGEQRRREAGNVFADQIRVGVAIAFIVKRLGAKSLKVYYDVAPDYTSSGEKLAWLTQTPLSQRRMVHAYPDKDANWINHSVNDWDALLPVADKKTKATKIKGQERAIFKMFSLGIVTNRDEWAYDFSDDTLRSKISLFATTFNAEIERWIEAGKPREVGDFVTRTIKWTSELEAELKRRNAIATKDQSFLLSAYRPFVSKWTYFAKPITHRTYQNLDLFPVAGLSNRTIAAVVEPRAGFSVLAADRLPNKDFFMPSAAQHFARDQFTTAGERLDNITDWALSSFTAHYGKAARISKDDIFHYVYGVLHDPIYRTTYAQNLKRDLPRIPLYPDFPQWAAWGKHLMGLHIGYEGVDPWPLIRTDRPDTKARAAGVAPKVILKSHPEDGSITLDSETTLTGIPHQAWDYRLGNRAGLDWVLDQHKEKTPKDPTIREKFNTYRFADHKEKVVDLIARVTRVSVDTMEIVAAMTAAKR
jgi:predicted helicase